MPLTTCPDCESEVSTKASACPNCGRPVREERGSEDAPEVIEETGKRFKRNQVLGAGGVLLGGVVALAGAGEAWAAILGATVAGVGVVVYLAARVGAWWHHE